MFKALSFFFLALSLLSCGKSDGGGPKGQDLEVDLAAITTEGPVPNEAFSWETNIRFSGFNDSQKQKVLEAADLVKQVIASEEFKLTVLNFTYNGRKQFVDAGMPNDQVYKKILEGSEKLNPGRNNTLDINLSLYNDATTVIGYTLPNINTVFMNMKYFNTFSPLDVSDNLIHEWLHKIGFTHAFKRTPSRPYSVPYAIGYIVKRLAAKYYH